MPTFTEAYAAYTAARKILITLDKLIRVFWVFVLWRRKVKVVDVLRAIQLVTDDPTIRNALLSVPHSRQLIENIDAHRRDLDDFAKAFAKVTKPMKRMLYEARILLDERRLESLREQFRADYVEQHGYQPAAKQVSKWLRGYRE